MVKNSTVWAKGLGVLGKAELPGSPLQWKRWSWAWSRCAGDFGNNTERRFLEQGGAGTSEHPSNDEDVTAGTNG